MKNKQELAGYGLAVLCLLGALCMSGYSMYKNHDYEDVCIAQRCTEWAVGDDWIKDNCKLENNQYRFCSFEMNGQQYNDVPLEYINLSTARSCREMECFTKILVKQEVK